MATSHTYRLEDAGIRDRSIAVNAAADALIAGKLAVLPTETVYGLAASAASSKAVAALALAAKAAPRPFAWHSHSAQLVRDLLDSPHAIHRRLLGRLLPGPVTFQVELSESELERIRERAHAVADTLHDHGIVAIRVPDHPIACDILEAAWKKGHPIVATAATGLDPWTDGSRVPPNWHPGPSGPAVVVDAGPTRYRRPSTTIRLLKDGGYKVVAEGALETRMVKKQLERTILFLCTGNTCRSPMAAAIARHLASETPGMTTRFISAGTAADEGAPATQETTAAVESLGIDPGSLCTHRSHELTRQMLAEAEVVFAMTASHARAAASIDPSAAAKIKLLDPDGRDVPDPIGGPQEVYTRTAERLKDLIQGRLRELDA